MELISSLLKWRDDRHRLAKLRYDLEDVDMAFRRKVQEEKLRRGSDEWDYAYSNYDNERELIDAEIDQIETQNYIRRARAWSVPIPWRPISEDPVYDDKNWIWSRVHGTYYLTDEGKALLRRETYAEIEMRYKQWTTWVAVGISMLSLIISLLRF
ncbi:hypothetical protein EXN71_31420 [Rhizobium rhizogenes]|uniref:hypothetical protein n=1 Tax=Rhizobium rhizogenes TaxID=359 RepID=UPI00115EC3F0|nr:hypothetical protein [Rhizobium rhizogenes]TRB52250.1 hypothetical protein EXN71_31420 [Rhizobium rhizogenes]